MYYIEYVTAALLENVFNDLISLLIGCPWFVYVLIQTLKNTLLNDSSDKFVSYWLLELTMKNLSLLENVF